VRLFQCLCRHGTLHLVIVLLICCYFSSLFKVCSICSSYPFGVVLVLHLTYLYVGLGLSYHVNFPTLSFTTNYHLLRVYPSSDYIETFSLDILFHIGGNVHVWHLFSDTPPPFLMYVSDFFLAPPLLNVHAQLLFVLTPPLPLFYCT
jgi:hypothetical protein